MDLEFQATYGPELLRSEGDGRPLDAARADVGGGAGVPDPRFLAVAEHGEILRVAVTLARLTRVRLAERSGITPLGACMDRLTALIDRAEEQGCVNLSQFSELIQELDLDDDELAPRLRAARRARNRAQRRLRARSRGRARRS